MTDKLSPEEQAQFDAMQRQESEEQTLIAQEKNEKPAPDTPTDKAPPQTATQEPPKTEETKTVPLAALQEEREERRKEREARVRVEARLNSIMEKLSPPQQPQQREIPDPEKDALGALKATTEEIKAFREFQQTNARQMDQQRVQQTIMGEAARQEAEFAKNNEDYGAASNHLRNSRYQELLLNGVDPLSAQQMIQQEAVALAATALKNGRNPAEIVYQAAKLRGYSKPSTAVQTASPPTDAERLVRIAEGQRQNTSLGNVNSTPGSKPISAKDIAAMDDEAFEKYISGMSEKQRASFLGA